MARDALKLTFDPLTIEHLGSNMYSRLPNAVAELVANAYDADATTVDVRIEQGDGGQMVKVSDNGHGMSWEDLADKYLRIGRNRREETVSVMSEGGRRRVSGKKGLGKLALFGIGGCVSVQTTRRGSSEASVVTLDWDELKRTHDREYKPRARTDSCDAMQHGTAVSVGRLARKTDISASDLAASLARLFQYAEDDLRLSVTGVDGKKHAVTTELRLDEIDSEFSWRIPDDVNDAPSRNALENYGITGRVVAARKPLRLQPKGVVVYSSGRLANEPEFFGAADSSYAYAYLTGYVTVNMLDDIKPDVIATDRRAVSWDNESAAPIHSALRQMVEFIARDRRDKRSALKQRDVEGASGADIDGWVASAKGPMREPLRRLLELVTDEDTQLSAEERTAVLNSIGELAPLFPELYWQDLHPWIQEECADLYRIGRYHKAVGEAWQRYIQEIRNRSGLLKDGRTLIQQTLGREAWQSHPHTALALVLGGEEGKRLLTEDTLKSLENGQRDLSFGVVAAFRNPMSHEQAKLLDELGIFTYRQALDALGVISLLCHRLEGAQKLSIQRDGATRTAPGRGGV